MSDRTFRLRAGVRSEWVRYQQTSVRLDDAFLRAGIAGAYLPRLRLPVPHQAQSLLSHSVPQCVSMVARYYGQAAEVAALALLLTDERGGTPARRLEWLKPRFRVEFPRDLQFFRDGTAELNHRLGTREFRLVYRWEERWLRCLRAALHAGIPPILFVDLGRLNRQWRGLRQPHAVVLTGGHGRHAWINDPAREGGPVRVGLGTLMDALLPGEPLAALLSPGSGVPGPESAGCGVDA